MNILVIGRDPKLFDKSSENFRRIQEYAPLFGAYHIVNMMPRGFGTRHEGNLFVYSTESFLSFLRWFDAIMLGKKIIREQKIDIIDAQDPAEAGLASYFLSRMSQIPFRLQIHTDVFSPYYRSAGWKEYSRYLLAKFLIPKANCIRVVSERIKKSVHDSRFKIHDARITVLPIFTDTSRFLKAKRDPAADERFKNYDFKMVAVGRFMDKEKNFSMLIEIMREFIKICPKALLVLVGDGPDRKNYKLQITNYKLQNHVILEGWRNDLPSFLKSFDLYLMPSNYEGWGRAAIEAMASGLAAVMTDVGLAGEIIKDGENGRVTPVGDKSAFLRAIIGLYKNKTERMRIADAARKTAEGLNVKSKSDYLILYRDALYEC